VELRAARRAVLVGVIAVPLGLSGCATSPTAVPAAASLTASSPAVTLPPAGSSSETTPQDAGNAAPPSAQMVCSEEIRSLITSTLGLDSIPDPRSRWADSVFSCAYALPQGPLVLSVTVAPTDAAAGDRLAAMRGPLGAGSPEPALGQQAFSADNGTVLAAKDNMVLHVDATALPDDLGVTHSSRMEFARLLTAGVFACWTGD
jgi:hypothetical protein